MYDVERVYHNVIDFSVPEWERLDYVGRAVDVAFSIHLERGLGDVLVRAACCLCHECLFMSLCGQMFLPGSDDIDRACSRLFRRSEVRWVRKQPKCSQASECRMSIIVKMFGTNR